MDDIRLLDELLKLSEGKDLDFKSTFVLIGDPYNKAKIVKNIISMANTPRDGSAFIIYGVDCQLDGTKNITGVSEHPDDNILQQLVASRVNAIPQFQYRPVKYNDTSLGIIEIFPYRGGPFIPQFDFEHLVNRGAIYYRQSSSTKIASSNIEIREIIDWMDKSQPIKQIRYSGLSFIDIGGGIFNYPCYFPSISSLRTQYRPLQYLKILQKSGYPWFLISAYDIAHANDEKQQIIELMKEALNKQKILLDSGYYESSSKNDANWKEEDYWDIVRSCDFNYAFSFDKRDNLEAKSPDVIAKEVIQSWKNDVEGSGKANIIPIVHANRPEDFSVIIPEVVRAINPIMVAIPERELGEGIISTAEAIFNIRKRLHEIDSTCPIHLLGTGNPVSILVYTVCGANSFDGLEWCQMVINYNTALPNHMKFYEVFKDQSDWAGQPGIRRDLAALMHNIDFFISWMTQIHSAIHRGETIDILREYLPLVQDKKGQIINPLDLLIKALPELFNISKVK
ncbi:ATP-binding protein [Chloroflexota bacterium]